jgi:hypothetical protein
VHGRITIADEVSHLSRAKGTLYTLPVHVNVQELIAPVAQGGADVDQFLDQNKSSSSGDNVNFSKSSGGDYNEPSYGSGSNTANQYSAQRQNQDLLNDGERDGPRGSDEKKSGGRDTGVVGDVGAAKTRERDHDYSGYGGEDCELTSGIASTALLDTSRFMY